MHCKSGADRAGPGVGPRHLVRGRQQPGRTGPTLLAVRALEPLAHRASSTPSSSVTPQRRRGAHHSCSGSSTNTTRWRFAAISLPVGSPPSSSTGCWFANDDRLACEPCLPAPSAAPRRHPLSVPHPRRALPIWTGGPANPRGPPCALAANLQTAAAPVRRTSSGAARQCAGGRADRDLSHPRLAVRTLGSPGGGNAGTRRRHGCRRRG